MKRLEIISASLAILGVTMMLLLIPGGSVLLGISFTILACIYYLFGTFFFNKIPVNRIFKKASYEKIPVLRLVGAFGGGAIFSILSVGMLFKLLQLPGAGIMLGVGLIPGSILCLVVLIKFLIKRETPFYRGMLVRSLLVVGLAGIIYTIPSLTMVKTFFRNHPDYIEAYEKAMNDPDDKELYRIAEEIREKIKN
ncbi:MAG: hypothetical protein KI791_22990 [Cyclobacteriaceae bacterium]|nr:hypothetical protein [Cyclobacteriaceae bacterium SS2]